MSKGGLNKLTTDQGFKRMLKKRKSLIEGIIDDVENQNEIPMSPYRELLAHDGGFAPIYRQPGAKNARVGQDFKISIPKS